MKPARPGRKCRSLLPALVKQTTAKEEKQDPDRERFNGGPERGQTRNRARDVGLTQGSASEHRQREGESEQDTERTDNWTGHRNHGREEIGDLCHNSGHKSASGFTDVNNFLSDFLEHNLTFL